MRMGLGLLIGFAVLTVLVGQRTMEPLDVAVMRAVQAVSGPELDVLAGVLNYVAAAEVTVAVGCLLSLWLWRRGVPIPAALAPLAFLLSLPLELALKFTLDQPVPSSFHRETLRYGLLTLSTMQSYPSGHAIRTAFFAVLLGFLASQFHQRPAAGLAWVSLGLLAMLSAWCRVYQGHHWPMDVVGGELFGAAVGFFAVGLLESDLRERPRIVRSEAF